MTLVHAAIVESFDAPSAHSSQLCDCWDVAGEANSSTAAAKVMLVRDMCVSDRSAATDGCGCTESGAIAQLRCHGEVNEWKTVVGAVTRIRTPSVRPRWCARRGPAGGRRRTAC